MKSNSKENNVKEIGTALPVSFTGSLYGGGFEDNPKLMYPRNIRVYAKMLKDAQVTAAVNSVLMPLQSTTWYIKGNGAPDHINEHIAGDLGLGILGKDINPQAQKTNRVNWRVFFRQVLDSLVYGHAFFEQVYEEGEDGRDHLKKLGYRPAWTIADIHVDNDGGLSGITQIVKGSTGSEKVFIPVNNLVAFIHNAQDMTWQGTSILRPAYKEWANKEILERIQMIKYDRESTGVPVYTGSPNSQNPKEDLELGRRLAQSVRTGSKAGAAIPAGASLKLEGVSGQIADVQPGIDYRNKMINIAVLAYFLNLGEGSYALSSNQQDLFVQSLQSIAQDIAEVASMHIVQDLVEIAYPEYTGPLPIVTCDPIASKREISAGEISQFVANKVIIPDENFENDIRRKYNMPEKKPYEEALKERQNRPETAKKLAEKAELAKKLQEAGIDADKSFKIAGIEEKGARSTTVEAESPGEDDK